MRFMFDACCLLFIGVHRWGNRFHNRVLALQKWYFVALLRVFLAGCSVHAFLSAFQFSTHNRCNLYKWTHANVQNIAQTSVRSKYIAWITNALKWFSLVIINKWFFNYSEQIAVYNVHTEQVHEWRWKRRRRWKRGKYVHKCTVKATDKAALVARTHS